MAEEAAIVRLNEAGFARNEASIARMLTIGNEALIDPSQVASFHCQCATLERTYEDFEEAYVQLCSFTEDEKATNGYTQRLIDG